MLKSNKKALTSKSQRFFSFLNFRSLSISFVLLFVTACLDDPPSNDNPSTNIRKKKEKEDPKPSSNTEPTFNPGVNNKNLSAGKTQNQPSAENTIASDVFTETSPILPETVQPPIDIDQEHSLAPANTPPSLILEPEDTSAVSAESLAAGPAAAPPAKPINIAGDDDDFVPVFDPEDLTLLSSNTPTAVKSTQKKTAETPSAVESPQAPPLQNSPQPVESSENPIKEEDTEEATEQKSDSKEESGGEQPPPPEEPKIAPLTSENPQNDSEETEGEEPIEE